MVLINYAFLKGIERKIAFLVIFICCVYYIIHIINNNYVKLDISIGENGHLLWHWADISLILSIIVVILYIYPLGRKKNKILFVIVFIVLLISQYFYSKYKTWSTIWCYFSNVIWIYFIYVSIELYIKNKYETDI